MSVRGIDVSDYQPNVNWQTVANSGIQFAFVKSTEGRTWVAETFARNWREMKATGILRGAYHFFRANVDAAAQAKLFLDIVKLEPGDLPPVLDVESMDGVTATTLRTRITQWLDIVEKATGVTPILYTYPGFWQQLGTNAFTEYPLWIAHYTTANEPWVTGGWSTWTFWQYTDQGRVNGAPGPIDVNIFRNFQKGIKGNLVTGMQKSLQKQGFDPGVPDGDFGPKTEGAMINFQKAKGLKSDGIVDIKTWARLMGKPVPNVTPAPSPAPAPAPTPVVITPPPSPTPAPIPPIVVDPVPTPIELLDTYRSFQGLTHQQGAVKWLQTQINYVTLTEFARRWRDAQAASTPPASTISLRNVCQNYTAQAHQDQAVNWLQSQLPSATLLEFARRWRNQTTGTVAPIRLLDVCKFYQGLSHQNSSLDWLQSQIPASVLSSFEQQWRNG